MKPERMPRHGAVQLTNPQQGLVNCVFERFQPFTRRQSRSCQAFHAVGGQFKQYLFAYQDCTVVANIPSVHMA
jgi:hypothetical protein